MTWSHDDIHALLADFVMSRLAPDQRRQVEAHLADCASCRTVAAGLEEVARQVRDRGEPMFEPHPEPAALRRHSRQGEPTTDAAIARHLAVCATCSLEVEAWKRPVGVLRSAANVTALRRRSLVRFGLSSAAAALVGLLVGWNFRGSISRNDAVLTPPGTPVAGGGPGTTATAPAPLLHLLPALVRDIEPSRSRWTLDRDDAYISVGVPISVPDQAADADRVLFELRTARQEPVWSQEMTVARIREHLDAAEVVNLAIVPERALEPDEYEFRVVPAGTPRGAPIYRARIVIDYRQSPTATKAPQ